MTSPILSDLETDIEHCLNNKTKPLGSLGRIEALAAQLALIQRRLDPVMEKARLLLFAADHGVAQAGVSAYPQEVTVQMLANFLTGGAAANVFARAGGVELSLVNAGVAGIPPDHPDLLDRSVGPGTANFIAGPAMTEAAFELAWAHGQTLGAEPGWNAVLIGEMGIGNTSAAALVAHKLTGAPLADLVGPGTGLDPEGLARKRELLHQAAARTTPRLNARTALTEYGGYEIVMMAAAMKGAADSGKAVLVDGVIATAAALAAVALFPDIRQALVFAHRSGEHGHDAMLTALDAKPLLDLGMRLGEGSGALLAWPLLRAAARMMREMASFDDAAISGPV